MGYPGFEVFKKQYLPTICSLGTLSFRSWWDNTLATSTVFFQICIASSKFKVWNWRVHLSREDHCRTPLFTSIAKFKNNFIVFKKYKFGECWNKFLLLTFIQFFDTMITNSHHFWCNYFSINLVYGFIASLLFPQKFIYFWFLKQ